MRRPQIGIMAKLSEAEYAKLKYLSEMFETTEKKTVVHCILVAYDVYRQALAAEKKHEDEGSAPADKADS